MLQMLSVLEDECESQTGTDADSQQVCKAQVALETTTKSLWQSLETQVFT